MAWALKKWSGKKFKDLDKQIDETEKALKAAQESEVTEASISNCAL